MGVNISAQFRKEESEFDGLKAIYEALLESPLETHTIVAMVERSALTINDRKGSMTPTVRLKWVEVVMTEEDEKAVREILYRRFAQRLGRAASEDLFDSAEGEPPTGEDVDD